MLTFIASALAQEGSAPLPTAAKTAATAATAGGDMDISRFFFQFVLIFAIFYLFLIRPHKKRMKQQDDMIQALGRKDVVVTTGGLVGTVVRIIDDKDLLLEIADNVTVRVERSRIASVRSEKSVKPASPNSKEKEPANDSSFMKKEQNKNVNKETDEKDSPKPSDALKALLTNSTPPSEEKH